MLTGSDRLIPRTFAVEMPIPPLTQVVDSDPSRVCLILSNSEIGGEVTIIGHLSGGAPVRFKLPQGSQLKFLWREVGPLVGARWEVEHGAVLGNLHVYTLRWQG